MLPKAIMQIKTGTVRSLKNVSSGENVARATFFFFLIVAMLYFGGPYCQCPELTPGSVLRNHFWQGSGGHLVYQGSKLSCPCAWLYYLSTSYNPLFQWYKIYNTLDMESWHITTFVFSAIRLFFFHLPQPYSYSSLRFVLISTQMIIYLPHIPRPPTIKGQM